MPAVVSDTSPLRALAHLGLLDLLRTLHGQILVPPAVDQELRHPRPRFTPVDITAFPFIHLQSPGNRSVVQQFLQTLHPGESEALALALEAQAGLILIDEAQGRTIAQQSGLRTAGVLAILLEAKQRGLIPAVGPLMDRLANEINFFISPVLRATVLRLAGEAPAP